MEDEGHDWTVSGARSQEANAQFAFWHTDTSVDFFPAIIIGVTNEWGQIYRNRHEETYLCSGCGAQGQAALNQPHVFSEWNDWRPSGTHPPGANCTRDLWCLTPGCVFRLTQHRPGSRDQSHDFVDGRCTRCGQIQ